MMTGTAISLIHETYIIIALGDDCYKFIELLKNVGHVL